MQENLTDVSEKLEEKAARTEETKLVSSTSCGVKKLCSDEGIATYRKRVICGAVIDLINSSLHVLEI